MFWHLLLLEFSELPGSVAYCRYFFSSCSFLPIGVLITCMLQLWKLSHGFFLFFFFILCILVWEVSIDSSSSSLILPFTVSRLLMSLLKAFFLSVTLFLIYNISFWFSLLLPIYSIILSTISTRALNTLLIIVILSPCAMILKSVSCAIWMWCSLCLCRPCFVSSLSMPCHFFCWKWSMMYEVIKLFLGS